MRSRRRKYRSSFYSSIVFFTVFDIGILVGWVTPRFLWLALLMMMVAAYSLYLSGPYVGLSKKGSALVAVGALLSLVAAMFLKRSIWGA